MKLIVTYFDFEPDISGTTSARSRIFEVDCQELEQALQDTNGYRQITLSYEMPEAKTKEPEDIKF